MAVRLSEGDDRGMSDFDDATRHDDDRPDTGHDSDGHDDVIVAQYADGSQVAVVDTNHDHRADLVAVDRDGDGNPEVVYSNEHGGPGFDTATYDFNDDGRADAVATDRDGDGRVDEVDLDRDNDGKVDLILLDEDFDGRPDHLVAGTGGGADDPGSR